MNICGEKTVVLRERRRGKLPSFSEENLWGFGGWRAVGRIMQL